MTTELPKEWYAIINKSRQEGVISCKGRPVPYEQNVEHLTLIDNSVYEEVIQERDEARAEVERLLTENPALLRSEKLTAAETEITRLRANILKKDESLAVEQRDAIISRLESALVRIEEVTGAMPTYAICNIVNDYTKDALADLAKWKGEK